jgi:ATP-binding cassette subfamily B protein
MTEESGLRHAFRRDRGFVRRLLRIARPYRLSLLLGLVLLFVQVLATNATPLLMKRAVDRYLLPGTGGTDAEGLQRLCMALAGLVLLMFVSRILHAWIMTRAGQLVLRDLRLDVFRKILALPLRRVEQLKVGRLMTRATSDLDAMQELLRGGVIGLLANLLLLVGAMVFMLWVEWRLALALYSVFPILAVLLTWINRNARTAQREARSAVSDLNSLTQESLGGLQTLRALNQIGAMGRRLGDLSEILRRCRAEVADWDTWHFPVLEMSRALATVVLLLTGALLVPDQPGALVAFLYYIRYFFRPLEELAEQSGQLQSGLASAERVFELLDEPDTLPDPSEPIALPRLQGDIVFERVTFGYEPGHPVVHDLSFHLKPGTFAAVVGATGAGKSTLLSLLCRFYDVNEGAIRIDGLDLRQVAQRDLRRRLGLVQQDPVLFSGSIFENLALGRPGAGAEEVQAAARRVGADAFIQRLPRGYDTEVGEGGFRLSTGQKQLLALARVLLQEPDALLLLDEATASIDSETEALIQKGMDELRRGRTCITIAHRLSTVMHADTLLVLRHGRLLEQGTHSELMETDGYYRALVEAMRRAHSF